MAITTFQSEIWAAELLAELDTAHVFGSVVNRDYEGEIRNQGDTVHITSIGDVSIVDYTGADLAREELTDSQQSLLIDQAKAFNFAIDDVDAAQSAGNMMPEAMRRAAHGLNNVADQFIAALHTGVDAGNALGATAVSTGAEAYEALIELGVLLDEADVPDMDRWVVVAPAFYGKLLLDDRFVHAEKAGTTAGLRNGVVGMVDNMVVHKSNNAPAGATTGTMVVAGYKGAITFAEQISKVEAYRPEDSFKDAVKGLHLYGAKLTRDTGIATADVTVS